MDNSSSIIKSGSSDIVGRSRSVGDLLPVDNSTETTAITPEQIQSIRNGLNTTIILTEQIVDVLSKSNDKLSRDIKKVRNLKRRLNRKIPTGLAGVLGSKFATDLLKKPKAIAKDGGTSILGALGLEAAASLLGTKSNEEILQEELQTQSLDNVIRKTSTMGLGKQFKRLWRRFFPNRKVTTGKGKSKITNTKKVTPDKKKLPEKKNINRKKLLNDLGKLKIPSTWGLILSLGGSTQRTKEQMQAEKYSGLLKGDHILGLKYFSKGGNKEPEYRKFQEQELNSIPEYAQAKKELDALPPWDKRNQEQKDEGYRLSKIMRNIYDKNIETIRYKFLISDDDLIERSKGTPFEIDPAEVENIRKTIRGLEKSNTLYETSSLNKDTSRITKTIVLITDEVA